MHLFTFVIMVELIKKFDTKCKMIYSVSKMDGEYEIVLRTQVNYTSTDCDNECMQRITAFSAATNMQWLFFKTIEIY